MRPSLLWLIQLALGLTMARANAQQSQDRECQLVPRRLPGVDEVVDSSRLVSVLSSISDSMAPATLVLSVGFDHQGSLLHVLILETAVSDDTTRAIGVVAGQNVRSQSPSDPWGVRLSIGLGGTPLLGAARSEFCPPTPPNGPRRVGHRVDVLSANDLARLKRAMSGRVRILVGIRGEVMRVELQTSSGEREVDEMALEGARGRTSQPASLDGESIEAWYEYTFQNPYRNIRVP